MMNQKPTLSGQRIKTRKRDEKEKYDPLGFRDIILAGFAEAGDDLDSIWKYLDVSGSKLDYRRYGEVLFDILIAGGVLAPGGAVIEDHAQKGCTSRTERCLFGAADDDSIRLERSLEHVKRWEPVFTKLMRRYKYLEKMFDEEIRKVLVYIKGFTGEQRVVLGRMTALWICNNSVDASVLNALKNPNLVKDGLAMDFLLTVLVTWKEEKGAPSLMTGLRRAAIDTSLPEFLPVNQRSENYLTSLLQEKGLLQVVRLRQAQANADVKKQLSNELVVDMGLQKPVKDMIAAVQQTVDRHQLAEHEIIPSLWTSVMSTVEWNKKEELVAQQALRHLRQYSALFGAFARTPRAQLLLLVRVQEFCYENMNLMNIFRKVIVLLYKTDVLSEDVVIEWYQSGHSLKGKCVFLEMAAPFVEWLQNAEEESESDAHDD